MNAMLRKYYAKLQNNRHSLVLSYENQRKRKKRTKSQSTFNNLTKTSEKSVKVKKTVQKSVRYSSKSASSMKKHKPQSSYIPKNFKVKPKTSPVKVKKQIKHKSISEIELSLSESYDSLLNHFDCGAELRKSLKQLVTLEKNALKRKFKSKSSISSNSLFVNSYHNSKV
jgi:hypothetical protein